MHGYNQHQTSIDPLGQGARLWCHQKFCLRQCQTADVARNTTLTAPKKRLSEPGAPEARTRAEVRMPEDHPETAWFNQRDPPFQLDFTDYQLRRNSKQPNFNLRLSYREQNLKHSCDENRAETHSQARRRT